MVYARKGKRTMRKRTRKPYRRTYTKKKFGKTGFFKVLRWSSQQVSNCHLEVGGNDALPNVDGTTVFQLNNVNGFGELVSLFDNYRITKVLYRWIITRTPDTVTTAANKGLYPRICWCHDFNDTNVVTRNIIYQRANMKEVYMGDNYQKTRWYSLSPAVLGQMYESSLATAYTPKWRQWLDTSDSATPHYGIKYSIDQNYTGMNVRLEAKIFIECKGIS